MLICFWYHGDQSLAGEHIPAPEIYGSGMVAEEHGIVTMIRQMRCPFISVQREAGRCFANLMATIENHDRAFDNGGFSLLISFLVSPDPACQRVGALGMQNLSTNVKFRDTMVDLEVFEPLASLARSEDT